MRRIAMLSVHTCPLGHLGARDTGGMNVYVRELSRELGRAGLKVDVFTRYRNCGHPCEVDLGEGARLVHLGAGEAELSKYDLYEHMPEFAGNVVNYQQSNSLTYDVIHSHYWLSGWVGELLKACWNVPHITTFHTLGRIKNLLQGMDEEPHIRLATEERAIRAADRILALTEAEKSSLVELYGVSAAKVDVIPGGVDTGVFRPLERQSAKRHLGLPPDAATVLYVGRIEPLKGLDILVKALALPELQDVHCLVVGGNAGDDSGITELRELARRSGADGRVSFLGPVEHEELPWYYGAADVTVVPSRYESFGLVALESLACVTPVVASAVGGLPTIVQHGENGRLVSRFDPAAFAREVALLLRNEPLRALMGEHAVETARKYSWPGIRLQVMELYRELDSATLVR